MIRTDYWHTDCDHEDTSYTTAYIAGQRLRRSMDELVKAIRAARRVAYDCAVTIEEATRALHKMIEQSKALSDKAIDYAYISQRNQMLMGRSFRALPLRGHRPVNMNRMQHK